MLRNSGFVALVAALWIAALAGPALGWTPESEVAIAKRAARFAPPDLQRQIEKYPQALEDGVLAAIENPAVGRSVADVLATEVERAVDAIRNHRAFPEIVQQLGQVTHYVVLANNPLAVGSGDAQESRYARDYSRYVESARPRFAATFYGDGRRVEAPAELDWLVRRAFERGRSYYPMIGMEYRRIDFGEGRRLFDDRSTAYGLAALAYSHSISDTIGVLRYIWLRAGGADSRMFPKLTPPSSP